jgi:hypothetical protein
MSVKEILREIACLDDEERLELQRALARRLEREFADEAAKARKIAHRRGITQATIDRALERRRYGPRGG